MPINRMSLRKKLALSALIAGCFAAMTPQAQAVDYYWNATGTQAWATGANWSNNPVSGGTTGVVPVAADNAIFNQSSVNGSSIATIAAATGITSVIFNNTGTSSIQSTTTTIQNLTASGTITVSTGAGGIAQIGLVDLVTAANSRPIRLAGAAGINITSGKLILNATTATVGNTFTGDITVAGTSSILEINSGLAGGAYTTQNPLGTKTGAVYKTVFLSNGATFRLASGTYNDNVPNTTNVGAGQIFNIGAGGGIFDVASGASLILDDGTTGITTTASNAQQLQGSGALTKIGTGTLTLRQQFNYAGAININAGLLVVSDTNGMGTTAGGTTIASGAALNFNGQTYATAEPLNISGTGLAATPVGVITNASTTAASFAGPITLGAASQIGVSNSGNLVLSGAMTGAFPLTINNTGTGVTGLSGASTAYTGGITVKSGTLRGSSANGLGANTNVITLGDTGTLSPAQPVVLDMNFAGTVAQPIVLATGAFTGGLTISSPNLTATTNVTGGVTGTNNLRFGITGTWPLRFSGAAIDNVGTLTNVGSGTGPTQIDSNVTSNITTVTQNSLTSGMTLAGTNAYTGSTTINAGVLTFYNTASLPGGMTPTQPVTVASTGVLGLGYGGAGQFTQANVTAFLSGTVPNVTFAATGTGIALDTTAGDAAYTPAIGNITGTTSSGLVKLGTNTLTVNPANTFTGAIVIQNGTLSTSTVGNVSGGPSGLGAQTNATDAAINLGYAATTGRLLYTGTGETSNRVINMLGVTGGATIEQAGTGVLAFSSNLSFTGAGAKRLTLAGSTAGTGLISGSIAGGIAGSTSPLTIAKEGTGTWTLSGAGNTATTLVMSGGTLDTTSNGLTISNAGAATIQATADSTLNGKIILGGVGTAGNGADFGATAAGVTLTVNAIIEGGATNNIDFWSAPAGVTILNGANTFTGQVAIAGQIVQVASINSVVGGTLSSNLGAPTTVNEGTIRFGQLNNAVTGTLRYVGTGETTDRVLSLQGTTGGAVIDQSGTGLLKFTSDLTATGAGSKTLTLQGSTTGTGEIGGAIVDNGGTNLTSVLKAGTGLWALSGASSYTGATTINGGTLAIRGSNGSTQSPTFNVNLGATLLLDNLDTANSGGRISDGAVVNVTGGTFDFSNNGGAVNYSEVVGTLNIGSSATSTVISDQAALGQTSALFIGTLTRAPGGTVNFTGTGLGVDTRNQVFISSQPAGNLPIWATINSTTALAAYDPSLGVVPATFTDIAAQSGVVPNGAGLNVRINSVGTPGNVTLASATTAINLLLQNTTTASTIDLAGGSIASTGFKINPGMQALTIGATAGNGTLSAAIAGGDVSFINSSSNLLTINSSIVDNTSASTVSVLGGGVTTLAGTNTYTGNTAVNNGTLNITGSLTGLATSSALRYGDAPGNTTVNISGNVNSYFIFTGANAVGSNTVMNQTAGSVSIVPTNGADTQWVAKSGYGGLNITGGTFNTGRFDVVAPGGTNGVGVVYVGGTGILNNNVGDWLILPRTNGTGQLTVGPGGTLTRTAAVTAQLAITMDGVNSNGTLNIAGGNVDSGVRAIQFGFGSAATSIGNRGFVNLASGTLSVGLAINQTNTAGQYFDYFNFVGGTLKMNAGVTWLPATSVAGHTLAATIYGPVTNNNNANSTFNSQIGATSNFAGGLTVDTNGVAATTTIAAPLVGATGVGVTQANIGDVSLLAGNSGYFGAPAVVFSAPAAGGVPASGYAVIDAGTGKVNGIVITNPGTYTASETPTITLSGGGGTIAPFNTTALATANTSGGLTKIGAGNLVLTGANSYAGDTNVNVGALIGGSPAALPGFGVPGKIVVASGATIGGRVGGAGFTEADIATLAANATISPTGYLGISTQNGSYVYNGSIGGNYGLQKLEANTLSLAATNTYTGPTDVNAGILRVGNAGTTGTLGSGAVTVNTGATLVFNRTDTYNLAAGNLFSGAGTIQLSSGGTVATAADNTFNMSSVLTFGAAANAATGGNLDLTLGGGTFTGLLSQTNSLTANTITIGAGKTLAINGNLDMTNTVDGANNLLTVTGAGALNVTGASISVGRNTGGTNISSKATLDMSGLATFTANLTGNLTVQQQGDNNGADLAQMLLANNSTITAASVIVGGSSTGAGTVTTVANQLKLGGGTNVINTALVHLGAGNRDSGQVSFNGATGTVKLRDVAGTGRANMTMGPLAAQTTAYVVTDIFDTTGHTADLAIGTFATSLGGKTAANTHDLKFNSGTLDILNINMAVAKGTGLSTSKIEIGGGTAFFGGSAAFGDTGSGSITLATQGAGELAITGGTVTSSVDINRGATSAGTNAILTLNGGALDMTNKSIGTGALPITSVNLQSGTLSNVLEINGGAAVSKTTAGTLTYTGTNAYTGATTVAAGKLLVNGSLPNSVVNVSALATIGGSGTIGQLTTLASTGIVSPGNSAGNLTFGGGADLSAGGVYNWELGALSTSNPGTDFDTITVSGGNIALAGTSALTLDFGLISATGPNSGNAFWTTPKTWKIIDITTGSNSGNTNLSTITNATFSSGTFATNVGAGADAGDIFLVFTPVVGGTSVWQGANNDPWTAAGSWTGSVPNSTAAEAKFVTTGGTTANLDANQTVNKLTFDATAPHTISGANKLTLAGTTPSISTAASNTATQTVAVNVELGNGTTINVQGGTLELNVPTTNATIGTGVTATVANGATLSLGGAGNALSNGTTTHANVTNNGTLAATTAGKRVGNIDGTGTTTVTAAGANLTASHVRQAGLTIGAGNTVTVAVDGGNTGTSTVTNLSINATGKLDLNDNDLVVDNGNLATLTSKLATGMDINGTYGNGPGGITSTAFATNPNFNTVLGVAPNSELGYSTFSGQTVDANDVLIKYTYYGDADLNGLVDAATDFDLYITGLTSGGSFGGWLFGDFDYNGSVDAATDFDLYITGLTSQGAPLLTAGGGSPVTAIPEPSTLVLAGLGVLGFAGMRLRKRRSVTA